MRIIQLSEEAELLKTSVLPPKKQQQQQKQQSMLAGNEQDLIEWKEDETCVQLCIRMPGVRAKDVEVSMQGGILSISGHHSRSCSCSSSSRKRQRLGRREFPVDTQIVDTERAMISLWGDMLILYAPKKFQSLPLPRFSPPTTEDAAVISYC
eukprot:scaffold10493_cov93-Cylindrotheca_fusiformis.AAC.3